MNVIKSNLGNPAASPGAAVTARDHESWLIDVGDAVIKAKAERGINSLSPLERLIYCLWVATTA